MFNPFKKKQVDEREKEVVVSDYKEKIRDIFERMDWSVLFEDPVQEGFLLKMLPIVSLILNVVILALIIKK